MILFPSDRLLPPPSVLAKLKALDPDAAKTIIERALEIDAQRQKREKEEQEARERLRRERSSAQAFLLGMASLFNLGGAPNRPPSPEKDATLEINLVWAGIGNDMRLSVGEYMKENNLLARDVKLTREEEEGLKLLQLPAGLTHKPAAILRYEKEYGMADGPLEMGFKL